MSRRIEITVPNDWAIPVRECLIDKDKCDLSEMSGKPSMVVELQGLTNTIFFVTVPGADVTSTLEFLRKNGIGVSVGRIILTTIEFLKPGLDKPLQKILVAEKTDDEKKGPLTDFQHFQKTRKTTEELYNEISNVSTINMNTWLNLVGASIMAAGGLSTNTSVYLVGAMLVSPTMGPILGMTLGYRIADWPLFRNSFVSEIKMAITAFLTGFLYALILGDVGKTFNWPTTAMSPSDSQDFNLVVSIIVSAAAGVVLGSSLTTTGGNAIVGTAISAGLLPPIVNAGMLIAYSIAYAPYEKKESFYEMGSYAILFYFTHVVTIVLVANLVFWLKDVDPRFRDGDDTSFDEIPSLVEHKQRLEASGYNHTGGAKAGGAKAAYFVSNIKGDIKELGHDIKDRAANIASLVTRGRIGHRGRRASSTSDRRDSITSETKKNDTGSSNNSTHKGRRASDSEAGLRKNDTESSNHSDNSDPETGQRNNNSDDSSPRRKSFDEIALRPMSSNNSIYNSNFDGTLGVINEGKTSNNNSIHNSNFNEGKMSDNNSIYNSNFNGSLGVINEGKTSNNKSIHDSKFNGTLRTIVEGQISNNNSIHNSNFNDTPGIINEKQTRNSNSIHNSNFKGTLGVINEGQTSNNNSIHNSSLEVMDEGKMSSLEVVVEGDETPLPQGPPPWFISTLGCS